MNKHTYEQIEEAIKQQKGGKYRLLLQRVIDGIKCRAYTRTAVIDGIQYWNIEYVTYGLCDAYAYAQKMFDIIEKKIDKMKDKEQIVLWRY
ncbi:MAG: hypothetical protein NC453_10515 [Muribaculum sp.]|nr:hypothetical protein [Muribaculum sp.]